MTFKVPKLDESQKKAGLRITAAVAIVGAIFTAGMSYRDVSRHVSGANDERHETGEEKSARTDSKIEIAIKPIQKQLDALAAAGVRRDEKLDKMMDYLINGRN